MLTINLLPYSTIFLFLILPIDSQTHQRKKFQIETSTLEPENELIFGPKIITTTNEAKSDTGLSGLAIAGIVVGSLILFIVLPCCLCFIYGFYLVILKDHGDDGDW